MPPRLVEIADAGGFELADTTPRRLEDEHRDEIRRREQPRGGLDVLGGGRFGFPARPAATVPALGHEPFGEARDSRGDRR
jgi:hypothetical protein